MRYEVELWSIIFGGDLYDTLYTDSYDEAMALSLENAKDFRVCVFDNEVNELIVEDL